MSSILWSPSVPSAEKSLTHHDATSPDLLTFSETVSIWWMRTIYKAILGVFTKTEMLQNKTDGHTKGFEPQ